MAKPPQTEIRARIVIERPVPGVAHSLQDKAGSPLDVKISRTGEALSFDFPIRISEGPKFYGEFVKSEGPVRRFIYICIGQGAGQKTSQWGRRMKIDIHTADQAQLDKAKKGKVLEAVLNGTGKDGTPACATVPVIKAWKAV